MSCENIVKVKFKMLEGCNDLIPKKAHHDDAAFDLMSRVDIEVGTGKSFLIPTGLFLELPVNYEAQVRPRSGLALKHSLTITNTPGTVDSGYRGEVCVIMLNAGTTAYSIKRGDRIAQMVINRLPEVELLKVDELGQTSRGAGGFGSSGKN